MKKKCFSKYKDVYFNKNEYINVQLFIVIFSFVFLKIQNFISYIQALALRKMRFVKEEKALEIIRFIQTIRVTTLKSHEIFARFSTLLSHEVHAQPRSSNDI